MSAVKDVAGTFRLTVPAGGARPEPPVGPALGQYGLNVMAFCQDFNARTQNYKPETPIRVSITAYKDNTFEFTLFSGSVSWHLKKAVGVESGTCRGHTLSVRHVHEIAKAKQSDSGDETWPLESISDYIMEVARCMGIKIVKDLD